MRYTTVLVNFSRDLYMIRKYGYSDSGINDIEFSYSNPNDYYRPILAKHAFDGIMNFTRAGATKIKNYKQTNTSISSSLIWLN